MRLCHGYDKSGCGAAETGAGAGAGGPHTAIQRGAGPPARSQETHAATAVEKRR